MKITKQEVDHIAVLARLKLTPDETELYTEQLNSILEYAEMLNQLDTENVRPTAHAVELFNVLREDEVKPSISQEAALKNAPQAKDGFFRVPKIV